MNEPSRLYMLIEKRIEGTLADFIAARRATKSWATMAAELAEITGPDYAVSDETLRRWFADRITVEVRVDAQERVS
jgi:hypothetical protein